MLIEVPFLQVPCKNSSDCPKNKKKKEQNKRYRQMLLKIKKINKLERKGLSR